MAFENLSAVVKTTADFILPMLLQVIVIVTLFVAIATIFIVLLTSHRISGPLFRLTIELDKIKEKDLTHPIQLRANDQLKRLARECEEMRAEYQRSVSLMKKNWQSVQPALQEFKKNIADPVERDRVEKSLNALASELARFKTE